MAFLRRRSDAEDIAETAAMDRFIDQLDRLDDGQLLALTAAWRAVDEETRDDAWTAVRATAARLRLTHGVDAVRERAMRWAMRADNRPPLYHVVADDVLHNQIRADAAGALVDTALGIALGMRLDPGSRATLLSPWESAIGSLESIGLKPDGASW